MSCENVFAGPLRVINAGIEALAKGLIVAGVEVVHLDWRPPVGGNSRLSAVLARLDDEEARSGHTPRECPQDLQARYAVGLEAPDPPAATCLPETNRVGNMFGPGDCARRSPNR